MLLVNSQLSPDISLAPRRPAPFKRHCRVAIGERIHEQVFHHARRLWLKSNTAFAVRLSTNSTVDMCKFCSSQDSVRTRRD